MKLFLILFVSIFLFVSIIFAETPTNYETQKLLDNVAIIKDDDGELKLQKKIYDENTGLEKAVKYEKISAEQLNEEKNALLQRITEIDIMLVDIQNIDK